MRGRRPQDVHGLEGRDAAMGSRMTEQRDAAEEMTTMEWDYIV